MDPSLLQPSLRAERPVLPLYSATACWLSAFFGGVIGGGLMFGLNAWRAGRWRRDAPWLIGGIAIALFATLSSVYWLPDGLITADGFRLSHRIVSLLLAGIWYSRLRSSFRAQDLMGGATASPWLAAIGAIALGFAAYLAVAAYLGLLR